MLHKVDVKRLMHLNEVFNLYIKFKNIKVAY